MAELSVPETGLRGKKTWRMIFAVSGIMTTLVIYGLLQACRFIKMSLGLYDLV